MCEGACTGDADYGGGIDNQSGKIFLTNCMVSNNRATVGGEIYNKETFVLTKSKIVNNEYTSADGGIYNDGGLSVTDATLSANSSAGIGAHYGGGIFNNFSGTLTISNILLADNEAHTALGSGGMYNLGTLHLKSSIIADSVSGVDCLNNGTIASNSKNLIEDNTCSPSKSGDPKLDTYETCTQLQDSQSSDDSAINPKEVVKYQKMCEELIGDANTIFGQFCAVGSIYVSALKL